MSTLTPAEIEELDRAQAAGRPTILLVHGLWLLSSSWDRWRRHFEDAGYSTVAPAWPDDPDTVEQARANPGAFAKKMVGQVTDHYLEACGRLAAKPAIVGHSFGGLIAQLLAGEGAASATVAIDAAPFRGVLPVPLSSLKSSSGVVSNPANAGRAVTLSFEEFRYGWANALPEDEARQLYDEYHVAASGRPIFQVIAENINPFTELKAKTKSAERGPLLLIAGERDHTIPPVVVRAEYDKQKRNESITEIVELPNRGHSLTIDNGWKEVADTALAFIRKHLPTPSTTASARTDGASM
ncbi:alpha/beta hydrolase [Rathayibacter sp. YIM 133350]|uniref:alpha/beta hydrolase n=1 Tax=Rathayibacter sp. YIM 133350 TaxID=3131992 RepID=UPI00307E7B3A